MSEMSGHIWVDGAGETCLHVIKTLTGSTAIEGELEAVSQAKVRERWEGTDTIFGTIPGTGTYITVRETAILYFTDGVGHVAKLLLPAPDASIFLSDGSTVDPTTIPSLITACIGNLLTGAGTTVTAFTGGKLFPTKLSGIATI